MLDRFASSHHPIRGLVAATAPEAVLRHDIYDLARPLHSFVRGRTALLGDAAHAMTPDLGQGAGQAIEGAATLALLSSPAAAVLRDVLIAINPKRLVAEAVARVQRWSPPL